jgi:hypothetical protein
MAPRGYRSWHAGPYHYCGRCGERRHLFEMEWQRGVLVCKSSDCIDYGENPLIGQREVAIIKAFEVPTQELQPDPKLINPESETSGDDLISF